MQPSTSDIDFRQITAWYLMVNKNIRLARLQDTDSVQVLLDEAPGPIVKSLNSIASSFFKANVIAAQQLTLADYQLYTISN